jgi:hypothetical protein
VTYRVSVACGSNVTDDLCATCDLPLTCDLTVTDDLRVRCDLPVTCYLTVDDLPYVSRVTCL